MSIQRWPIGEEIRYDGSIHPLVAALPHYHRVPKEPRAHLEYRRNVLRWAHKNPQRQAWLKQCAAEDVLWFVNTFAWLIEPRGDGKIPFNTWPHQDVWLAATAHYSGWTGKEFQRDQVGRKSRAQGYSWGIAAEFVRAFLFRRDCIQGVTSKDEDTADNPMNPNSFGWKVDYLLANLPSWMRPPQIGVGEQNRRVSDHTWFNPLDATKKYGNNYIMADAATAGGFRGGRLWRSFSDEAAFFPTPDDATFIESLRAVTDCRMVGSTPNGTENKFYELVNTPSSWLQFVLHWQDNPDHNAGMYTTENGRLKILKGERIEGYHYVLDGRVRSPWYDAECDRAGGNLIEIARELDIDFGGSKGRPFPENSLQAARQFCADPVHVGMLDFADSDPSDVEVMQWHDGEGYPLKLWKRIDSSGYLPLDEYVVGCDIAAGSGGDGSSNSVIQVFSAIGEQIGEFSSNTISPEDLARLAIAVCYWLGRGRPTPFLIWESNGGLGSQFWKEIERQSYPYYYLFKDGDKKRAKRTQIPGYHTTKTQKTLAPLVAALNNRQLVIRSRDLIRECGEYIYGKNDWEHPKSKTASDNSQLGINHGDRAMAAALCIHALRDRKMLKEAPKPKQEQMDWSLAHPTSMAGRAYRRMRAEEARARATSCVW